MAEIVARLHRHRRGLIVGEHGTGKTTLLQTLRPVLCDTFADIESVQLSVPRSVRLADRYKHARRAAKELYVRQARLRCGGLLVIDGAEQLWRLDLARLAGKAKRRGQAVLATSHSPIGGMVILYQTKVTRELVLALAESLLAETSPALASVVREELGRRNWSTLTNVRDLWFELYDVVQPHLVPVAQVSTQQE